MLRRTLRRRRAGYRKSCKSIVNGPRHIERQSDRPPPLRTASRVSLLCGPPQLKMNFLKFNLVVRTAWGPTSLALVLHVYKKPLNAYNEDFDHAISGWIARQRASHCGRYWPDDLWCSRGGSWVPSAGSIRPLFSVEGFGRRIRRALRASCHGAARKPGPGKMDGRRARYRRGHENRDALPIRSRALPICGGPAFSLHYR